MKLPSSALYAACLVGASFLAGCGSSTPFLASPSTATPAYSGRVHGGEQPVAGAVIQLYTVGTAGDGSAATSLLNTTVATDSNGNFTITGLYSCSAATDVFLLSTGGNPGLSSPNPNLTLLAALGPCSSLTPQTFISVNELTTVAAVYALAPYMSSATHIGSSAVEVADLNAAFTLANQLVNTSTGTLGSSTGATIPAAKFNTLADLIASCINTSGGSAGDGSVCGTLFALATTAATSPSNTVDALLNIANDPTVHVPQLFSLIPATAPFQPSLPAAPADFGIGGTASANMASGLQISPPALTFPPTAMGGSGTVQTIAVSNAGSSPIAFSSLTFTGPNAGDFSQTNTCGTTLAADANCTATIQFQPGTAGPETATAFLASSTPDSPQAILLSGTGISASGNGPHAVVSSTVVEPYPGASFDITLANTGNAPLPVSSIALENTPFNTQSNNCPSALPAAASCTITLHSIAPGADQLTILTNDPNFIPNLLVFQPSVYLNPGAINPVLSPSDIFFPDATVGSPQNITYSYLINGSTSPTLSGPQASDFSLSTPTCAITFPGVDTVPTCTITLTFTPSAPGLRTARLTFDSTPNYLPLAGTGIAGPPASGLTVSASSLSFDFNSAPQTLTFTNPGTAAISLGSISIQSLTGPSEYAQTNNCGATLAPQASCALTVTSIRLTEGATEAMLTIATGTGTLDIPLSNKLYPVLNLGPTGIGSASLATQYPVVNPFSSNAGATTLNGVIAGASSSSFTFTNCTSSTTPCIAVATFSPSLPGLASATLTTTNTYPGLPPVIRNYSLLGTGATSAPAANLALSQTGFSIIAGQSTMDTLTMNVLGPAPVFLSTPTLSGGNLGNSSLGFSYPVCIGAPTGDSVVYAELAPATQCIANITENNPQAGFTTAVATVTDSTSGLSFSLPMYFDTIAGPTVSPSSITFPNTTFNTFSPPQSVTVARPFGHPISVTVSANVVPIKGICTATEVPCILTFVFAPTAGGNSSYPGITVNDTYWQSSTFVGAQGAGVPPVGPTSANATPNGLTFPTQGVGTASAPQTMTLNVFGSNSLGITSITLTGANASEFTETNNCGASVAPGFPCTITVSFAPSTPGTKAAQVIITGSTQSGLPISLPLSGVAQ